VNADIEVTAPTLTPPSSRAARAYVIVSCALIGPGSSDATAAAYHSHACIDYNAHDTSYKRPVLADDSTC